MASIHMKVAAFVIFMIAMQMSSNTPSGTEGSWWRGVKLALKPTCAGCAGICERKASSGCRCIVDQECMKRYRG